MAVSRRPAKFAKRRSHRRARGEAKEKGFILTVTDGNDVGAEYFFENTASIGRVDQNDIVLVEPGISRNHARIEDDHGIYMLVDLGSANGTRLNGRNVSAEEEVLRDGDYITFSQTTLQFSQLDAARGEITQQTTLSDVEARALDRVTQESSAVKEKLSDTMKSRRGKVAAALVVAVLVGVGAYFGLQGSGKITIFDQSDSPLTYSEDDAFFNAVYGNGKYDKSHKNALTVDFEYRGGRATVQYGAWGVDKVGELVIFLNGKQVGATPLTMQRWIYGLKQPLPRHLLKKKETNRLIFNNIRNPPGNDPWEVCYLQIVQEAIPPADPREARHLFELAKKSWEDREIEPSNMYTALEGFKKARDLLENLPEKPSLYQEAQDFYNKVDKALTRKFEDGLFSARRSEKLDGEPAKARVLLLQARRFFHKSDFRYREIQRYLDSLAEL